MSYKVSSKILAALLALAPGTPFASVHEVVSRPGVGTALHQASPNITDPAYDLRDELVNARTEVHMAAADDQFRTAPEDRAAEKAQVEQELKQAHAALESALETAPALLSGDIHAALDEVDAIAAHPSGADTPQRFAHLEEDMWRLIERI